jgi:tRNA-dihydrouridine synthase A
MGSQCFLKDLIFLFATADGKYLGSLEKLFVDINRGFSFYLSILTENYRAFAKHASFISLEEAYTDGRMNGPRRAIRRDIRGTTRLLSVAPMMDWTDRHYRFFVRQLTRRTLLYTEMVTMHAVLHGDRERLLSFSEVEKPLVLQLGGDDPAKLAECARIAESWGYDEVNLNVGCPSERVQSGNFGACLMLEPGRVAACVAAMRGAVNLPVTVKHRTGVDERDGYEDLRRFVDTVAEAGCERFIIHARKAWLKGLSPKENRTVPPLRYEEVYRLKEEFPELLIEINGGFTSLETVSALLEKVDGVMVGRAAYENPYLLAAADRDIFGEDMMPRSRREVVLGMLPYLEQCLLQGVRFNSITRHMLGLFAGQPGARAWKRHLSEHAHRSGAGIKTVLDALEALPDEVLDARPAADLVVLEASVPL